MSRTLRWFAFLLLLLVPAGSIAVAQGAEKQYGRTIYLAADASTEAQASADALALWLGRMTGATFTRTAEAGKTGIFLALESSPVLPAVDLAALKAQTNPEAFLLHADAKALWIVGKSEQALSHGVYWYLDKLGCRWLLPGEKWTIIPKRADITLTLTTLQAPVFLERDFFGTGGFGRPTIDPKTKIADGWALYKRQNLLGGTIKTGGHVYQTFNILNKAVLEAHPEYLAEINGKRQPFAEGTKPCYSNPDLQQLFVKERLNAFKRLLERDPNAITISVEPSDGGGHCECAACRKLGSVSDRVFTLANVVARAVAQEYPGKYVSLLAYNEHAAVPAIPLEKNMIIKLAPYAFQRTGLTPHQMIEAWGKKHHFLCIYTYWNIPDWSRSLPRLTFREVSTEIRFWQANNIRAHGSESTYSGGNTGPHWYLAARLMWEPSRNEREIIDDYFAVAFAETKAPVRRMYDRWESGFALTEQELALCYRDLGEALRLAKDPAVRLRVIDMGRFVHYMRLWYEYQHAHGEDKVERAKAVLTYLWKIYDSNMIQSFRLARLLERDMKPHLDEMNSQQAMWKEYPQHTDDEILALLADGKKTYQPLDFTPVTYTGALKPLQETAPKTGQYVTIAPFSVSSEFTFAVRPGAADRVVLKMQVLLQAAGRSDQVTVTDPTGKTVFEQRLPANGEWVDLEIPTTAPGNYKLAIMDQKNRFSLQIPADLPFVCSGLYSCSTLGSRTYFYVPRGLRAVAVHNAGVIPIIIYDPNGKVVRVEENEQRKPLFLIPVPEGMDGKLWSFSRFKGTGFKLLNAPSVFSFSPDGMMAPEDALK